VRAQRAAVTGPLACDELAMIVEACPAGSTAAPARRACAATSSSPGSGRRRRSSA